jgi:hypothetical protein
LTSYDRSTVWYISVSSLPLCDWLSWSVLVSLAKKGWSVSDTVSVPLAVVEASRNMMPIYLSPGPCPSPSLACLCLCPTGCLVRLSLLALRKPGRKKRGASQSRGAQPAQCQILLANFTNICALRLLFWPLNFFLFKDFCQLSAVSRI